MSEGLKPCPICNSEAVDGNPMPSMSDRTPKTVKCSNYRCVLSRIHLSIEAWNTRPIEDELRKELEEVKFALQVEEHDNEYSCNKIDKLEAENTRLRDALKSASTYISQNNTHWNAPYHNETTRKIIEALKEK